MRDIERKAFPPAASKSLAGPTRGRIVRFGHRLSCPAPWAASDGPLPSFLLGLRRRLRQGYAGRREGDTETHRLANRTRGPPYPLTNTESAPGACGRSPSGRPRRGRTHEGRSRSTPRNRSVFSARGDVLKQPARAAGVQPGAAARHTLRPRQAARRGDGAPRARAARCPTRSPGTARAAVRRTSTKPPRRGRRAAALGWRRRAVFAASHRRGLAVVGEGDKNAEPVLVAHDRPPGGRGRRSGRSGRTTLRAAWPAFGRAGRVVPAVLLGGPALLNAAATTSRAPLLAAAWRYRREARPRGP